MTLFPPQTQADECSYQVRRGGCAHGDDDTSVDKGRSVLDEDADRLGVTEPRSLLSGDNVPAGVLGKRDGRVQVNIPQQSWQECIHARSCELEKGMRTGHKLHTLRDGTSTTEP